MKGWSRSRLAGYVSAGLSVAGTAVTFLAPSNIFTFVTFGTTLTSAFALAQSLLAPGWYDDSIDSTDPDYDTVQEVDPFFSKARNYLLFGSLAAFATDALVLAKLFVLKPADAPPAESEPLPPADETDVPVELSLW